MVSKKQLHEKYIYSFLYIIPKSLKKAKNSQAEIFSDSLNADKVAVDYKKEIITVDSTTKLKYRLASGGGLAMIIK